MTDVGVSPFHSKSLSSRSNCGSRLTPMMIVKERSHSGVDASSVRGSCVIQDRGHHQGTLETESAQRQGQLTSLRHSPDTPIFNSPSKAHASLAAFWPRDS